MLFDFSVLSCKPHEIKVSHFIFCLTFKSSSAHQHNISHRPGRHFFRLWKINGIEKRYQSSIEPSRSKKLPSLFPCLHYPAIPYFISVPPRVSTILLEQLFLVSIYFYWWQNPKSGENVLYVTKLPRKNVRRRIPM